MKKLFNRGMSLTLIVCLTFVICLCGCNNTDVTSSDTVTSSDVSSNTAISSSTSSTTSKTVSKADKTASKSSQTSKTSSESQTSSEAELIIPDIVNRPIRIPGRYTYWYGTMDAASFLLKYGIAAEGKVMVDYAYIFDDGEKRYDNKGTIEIVIDKDSLIGAVAEIYTDMINDYLTENDLTREELLVKLDATLDSYIEFLVQQEATEAVKKMNLTIKTQYYEFVAGVLYFKVYGTQYFRAVERSYNEDKTQMTLIDEGETFVLRKKK